MTNMEIPYDEFNIQVNTIDGAKELASFLLKDNTQRLSHTLGVVKKAKAYCDRLHLDKDDAALIIQSAYLHDIGYSEQCNSLNFHAVDGFLYLTENRWNSSLCNVVLHHSYSELLATMSRKELMPIYEKNSPTSKEKFALQVLTDSDLRTSATGEDVTFEKRILGIKERYPETSVIVKHIEKVKEIHDFTFPD